MPVARATGVDSRRRAAVDVAPSSKRGNDEESALRRQIIAFLRNTFVFGDEVAERMESNDDRLDAALCCLAGLDFLVGNILAPADSADLATEGWIWVRPPMGGA